MRLPSVLWAFVGPFIIGCSAGVGGEEVIDRARSTVVASAASVAADGMSVTTITAVALDPSGQPVGGVALTFSATGSGNSWSATTVTTGSDGSARASLSSTQAEVKTIAVDVTNAGVFQRLDRGTTIEFVAGPLFTSSSVSTVTAEPADGVIANGVVGSTIRVTVLSGAGVPIAGARVDFATGGAMLVPTSVTAGADGVAVATLRATVAGAKAVTVRVTPAGGGTAISLAAQPTVEFVGNAATIDATNSSVTAKPSSGVLADGSTKSTITVTVRDALGNPVAGQTVTLAATGTGNSFFQPFFATDADGKATGYLCTTAAAVKIVSATVNPSSAPIAITQTVAVTFQSSTLELDDAHLIYGESGILNPIRTRNWDDSVGAWSAEASLAQIAAPLRWTLTRLSPANPPGQIAATLTAAGSTAILQVYRRITGKWTPQWTSMEMSGANSSMQGFDLEFEQSSGHAMIVYSNNSSVPRYRTFDGSAWSTEAALPLNDGGGSNPDPNTGTVTWVELVNRPGTDELALLYADANDDLVAIIWSGSAWTTASATTLETALKTNSSTAIVSNRAFDAAYEGNSGDLLVCWAQAGSNGFRYASKAAGGSSWTAAATVATAPASTPHFVDLAGQAGADRIAGVFAGLGDGIERLGLAMWTGSGWSHAGEYDSQIRDVNNTSVGDQPAGVAWLGTTTVAICVYADQATGGLDWVRWDTSNGWVTQTDLAVAGKGFTESVQIQSCGTQAAAVVVLTDSNQDLYMTKYDGSTWRTVEILENSIPRTDVAPFGFALRGGRHN